MTDVPGDGRWGRLTRRGRIVLGVLAILAVVGLGGGMWVLRQVNPAGGPGAKVAVDVEPGTSVAGVAARLNAKGVVKSARIFRLYLKLKGGAGAIQAGEYELRTNLSMGDARAALIRGPSIRFQKFTIPEGFTLDEIADRVGALPGRSRDRFLAAARSGAVRSKWQPPGKTNLEGLLFPDTYLVTDKDDEAAIVRRLVDRFDQVADQVGLGAAAVPTGLRPYQLIVGASLVESGTFDQLYLHNLRLWQLLVMCGMARQAERLKGRLKVPLEVAHLILVQHTPLAIRFRFDEKRFDIDGAYTLTMLNCAGVLFSRN